MADDGFHLRDRANAYRALVDAGFRPESVAEAVRTGDLEPLWREGGHWGPTSVQLQPPQEPC